MRANRFLFFVLVTCVFEIAPFVTSDGIAPTPFSFDLCLKCDAMDIHEPHEQADIIQCCNVFTKCCEHIEEVGCPQSGHTGNVCNQFGPFCASDNNCANSERCCPSTDGTSFSCCWNPLKVLI